MPITSVKIFPSIGIARLGNSPEFFIGPEIPGVRTPPAGGYRDASCRVKRQAARFRLYGFDGNTLVQEITAADATITWTAHLANKKASWRRFNGLSKIEPGRNNLTGANIGNFPDLEINPGARTLNGPSQAAGFNTGRFKGRVVPLGEMRTDSEGRLLILGGFGLSGSVPNGLALADYANNNGWFDDVSDGPVKATVVLNGTATVLTAAPAWVICPPPDFAPSIDSITTLYDVLFQKALDLGLPGISAPGTPSFNNDIYPILQRVLDWFRASKVAGSAHSVTFPAAFPPAGPAARQVVFNRLRDPNNPNGPPARNMPLIYDDSYQKFFTVTKTQFGLMQKWAAGNFTDDWTGSPQSPSSSITPDGLTRAALEPCVGGALYPGIEAGWFLRDTYTYSEPFRLNQNSMAAGDVTKQMAVPWQADFYDCRVYQNVAWWPAQRPDEVFPETGGPQVDWTRDIVFGYLDMVNNWQKLGFVVNKGGNLVETERRVVCTNIFLVTDKSSFSEDEVAALLLGGSPASFKEALFVVAEGFLPAELGVTQPNPPPATLAAIAPTLAFQLPGGATAPGIGATSTALELENPALPANQRQRFTFVYSVDFSNTDAFFSNGVAVESQLVTVTATKGNFTSSGVLTLFHQPNPYMLDGPVSWLSTDVRVFQLTEGQPRFGFTIPSGGTGAAARSYVANVLNSFNTLGPANHPFDGISTDPNQSWLELSEKRSNLRVFNFAIARVRYRGNVLTANDVKVFFRLFTTAVTGMDYAAGSTYRRSQSVTDPVPLLGLQGGQLVTIPFFAAERVNSSTTSLAAQTDPLNVKTLQPAGATEVQKYYGCWLDINDPLSPQIPKAPSPPDGPWASGRVTIQNLIRGIHQCLVAEVYFKDDLIPDGASPATADNLAQRNLVIVESPNPGTPASRTVQHTFEIKATRPVPQLVEAAEDPDRVGARREVLAGPDELMIRWNTLPRATRMELYVPDVDADEVLRYAGQNYEAQRLEKVDAHTLRCLEADITYIPLPMGRTRNIAALLTLELPAEVREGQQFQAVVQQISGRPRSILGGFQFTIPVSTRAALLDQEIRRLSVLRHIQKNMPADDQWRPVFERYLDGMADRVREFGGNPDRVEPAPDGSGRDEAAERCTRRGWLVSALLALLVAAAALHPAGTVVAVAVAIAIAMWRRACSPSRCQVLHAILAGLGLGAAVVGVLLLLGLPGRLPVEVLALSSLAFGITVGIAARWRCLRFAGR